MDDRSVHPKLRPGERQVVLHPRYRPAAFAVHFGERRVGGEPAEGTIDGANLERLVRYLLNRLF